MSSILRRLGLVLATTCALVALHGCGGDDDRDAAMPLTPEAAGACPQTPAVEARSGYPVHDMRHRTLDEAARCEAAAYYLAGYAILSSSDVDPWNEPDTLATVKYLPTVPAVDPEPGNEEVLHQRPIHEPEEVSEFSANHRGLVYALVPGGQGEPWECATPRSSSERLQEGLENCLARLRAAANEVSPLLAGGSPAGLPALADGGNFMGDAKLDSTAWTSLGSTTRYIKTLSPQRLWGGQEHVGDAEVVFTLYRLNSAEDSDYYLVKGNWSVRPQLQSCDRFFVCKYYNNEHLLSFKLERRHEDPAKSGAARYTHQLGQVESYAPQTVTRKKTYSSKFGGGLKVSDFSLSSEISTTYSYDAASIISDPIHSLTTFRLSHATSAGVLSIGGDLWDNDPTTLGGMTTTVWALYKFPIDTRDELASTSMILTVQDFRGSFGQTHNGGGLTPQYASFLDHYVQQDEGETTRAFAGTFSLPHFSVLVQNDEGDFVRPPIDDSRQSTAADPLPLKAGQTVRFFVDSGGPTTATANASHPITLSWQLLQLPSYLTASNTSGNQRSAITIRVAQDARPGNEGYLRFNTSPRGAAPGLQAGDIAVPFRIVP